jgi:multiple sugar transport system ATP-binding protein
MTGLTVRDLLVAYRRNVVLEDVSLDVETGETLALVGPSGAGKTVLLRAIAGLEPAAVGAIMIEGRDVSTLGPEVRDVGVAFQNFALYPHMSAHENIASPLRARHLPLTEIEVRINAIAALLRIDHVLDHMPRALSNGQKQRTALARALVAAPKVLLLDDPLRNVDAKLRYEMRLELPRLLRRAGTTTIYVTQDYREAMALGDRIAVLLDGSVVQNDTPERIYDAPTSVAVARLFGDPPLNLLPCRPVADDAGVRVEAAGFGLSLAADRRAVGRECLLGIRSEAITLNRQKGTTSAELVAVTPLHDRFVLLLRASTGEEILASVAGDVPPAGSAVSLSAAPARALLFDAQTGLRIRKAMTPVEAAA